MFLFHTENHKSGFTLIELLVVIAIISILATVVLASLNSARSKARDTQRKAALNQIRVALELYYDEHGTYQVQGGGWRGGGNGWLNYIGGSDYTLSVVKALYNEGYIGAASIEDPIQSPSYMIYLCSGGQSVAISATLEKPTPQEIAFIQTTCNGTGSNGTYTRYGKNYAVN